jgi:hypothetical protein
MLLLFTLSPITPACSCSSLDQHAMAAALTDAHAQLSSTIYDLAPSQINSKMSVKKAVVLLHASMHDRCVLVRKS